MPWARSRAALAKASFIGAIIFGLTAPTIAQEIPNLTFVSEYIRELGKVERLRSLAMDEMKDESNRMASCIRSATRFSLSYNLKFPSFAECVLRHRSKRCPAT